MTHRTVLRTVSVGLALLASLVHPAAGQSVTGFDLQAVIESAKPGDEILVPAGVHRGSFLVDRPLRLIGEAGAILDGGGTGNVLRVTAKGTTIRGLTIRDSGKSLDHEDSGISILAGRATIEDNVLEEVLFGIYLKNAPGSVIRNNQVGCKDLDLPRRGDGIRLWYSTDCLIEGNRVRRSRDVVIWFSSNVRLLDNHVSEGRYGLHFMYSTDNWLEGNLLEDNAVGSFLMYSKNLTLRRNTLRNNRGPSGYGVGLKDMDGVDAQDNLFVGNRVGLFLDNSPGSVRIHQYISNNVFAYNDIGVSFLPSVKRNHFSGNTFLDNLEQVAVQGGGEFVGNEFTVDGRGNFWSDYRGYDLDGDGVGDVSYRSESLFENLIDRDPELRLFLFSPAQQAIEAAATAFPIMRPRVKLTDHAPLMESVEVSAPIPAIRTRTRMLLAAGILLLIPSLLLAVVLSWRRRNRSVNTMKKSHDAGADVPILRIDRLTKNFGSFRALKYVSFSLGGGEAVALWGQNGAGKTTVIKCILGLHACDGKVDVLGHDALRNGKAARRLLGYVPQELALYDDLTALAALQFYAKLRRLPRSRAADVLEQVGLTDHRRKRVSSLSGGMKQRLALGAALLSDPPLLILDEMTSNLDTTARSELLGLLLDLREHGKTILFTSHRLDEVEQLADRVLVLDAGRVEFECPPRELGGRLNLTTTLKLFVSDDQIELALGTLHDNGFEVSRNGTGLLVEVQPDQKALPIKLLVEANVVVRDFDIEGDRGGRS